MSVMYHVNLRIIRRSITRLTVDGLDALDPAERYLDKFCYRKKKMRSRNII